MPTTNPLPDALRALAASDPTRFYFIESESDDESAVLFGINGKAFAVVPRSFRQDDADAILAELGACWDCRVSFVTRNIESVLQWFDKNQHEYFVMPFDDEKMIPEIKKELARTVTIAAINFHLEAK